MGPCSLKLAFFPQLQQLLIFYSFVFEKNLGGGWGSEEN